MIIIPGNQKINSYRVLRIFENICNKLKNVLTFWKKSASFLLTKRNQANASNRIRSSEYVMQRRLHYSFFRELPEGARQ